MKSADLNELKIACMWLPPKGVDPQKSDNMQHANVSTYKKIYNVSF
mgnify:CR=1 FL=1